MTALTLATSLATGLLGCSADMEPTAEEKSILMQPYEKSMGWVIASEHKIKWTKEIIDQVGTDWIANPDNLSDEALEQQGSEDTSLQLDDYAVKITEAIINRSGTIGTKTTIKLRPIATATIVDTSFLGYRANIAVTAAAPLIKAHQDGYKFFAIYRPPSVLSTVTTLPSLRSPLPSTIRLPGIRQISEVYIHTSVAPDISHGETITDPGGLVVNPSNLQSSIAVLASPSLGGVFDPPLNGTEANIRNEQDSKNENKRRDADRIIAGYAKDTRFLRANTELGRDGTWAFPDAFGPHNEYGEGHFLPGAGTFRRGLFNHRTLLGVWVQTTGDTPEYRVADFDRQTGRKELSMYNLVSQAIRNQTGRSPRIAGPTWRALNGVLKQSKENQ